MLNLRKGSALPAASVKLVPAGWAVGSQTAEQRQAGGGEGFLF